MTAIFEICTMVEPAEILKMFLSPQLQRSMTIVKIKYTSWLTSYSE